MAHALEEPELSGSVGFAEAPDHPQGRLEQRESALRLVLMHVTTAVLFLHIVEQLLHLSRQGPNTTSQVGHANFVCLGDHHLHHLANVGRQ
jgi:hypothetical protein